MGKRINFEQHVSALTRYANSLTRNQDAANDLVQDTIMKILTRDPDVEHIENEKSYLMSTLRNLFIDGTRRGKSLGVAVSIDDFDMASGEASQNLKLSTKEIVTAVTKLPSDISDVLLRHARDDQSYSEIAGDLGIPVGTVMSRMSRARQELRKTLCPNGGDCEYAMGRAIEGF